LIDGSYIFAASQDNVEADRKGQRGQKAEQTVSVALPDLKCTFLL